MSRVRARKWLKDHVGQQIETVQTFKDGRVWTPGPRTLTRQGTNFYLDGSNVSINERGKKFMVTPWGLKIVWIDFETKQLIHVTVYTPAVVRL